MNQNTNTRVRIAFLFLFVFIISLSFGAYFITKLQEGIAARENQTALQGITDLGQVDEALRRHPSNKILKMIAMAAKAADETSAASEALSNEVEPPALSRTINLATASRSDLEALRRDLKTAEANATTFMPRYIALFKTERDKVEAYALSLSAEKDIVRRFLDGVDKRHARTTAVTSETLSARADYYRAYESYVAVLVGAFGTYQVVNGEFIFRFQPTVNRYNIAANAMTAAAKRIAELKEEGKSMQSQQEELEQLVKSE